MKVLPGSPRARRRLARLAVAAALAAVVAVVIVLLPSNAPKPLQPSAAPAPDSSPPSQPVSQRQIRLTAADRAQIDRTLDVFVPAVVERRDIAAGYDAVTPSMREGQTRARWARNDPPVMLYPARGRRFHGWTLTFAYPDEVSIELMLQPRAGAKTGPITFNVGLRPSGKRWLVDSIAPAAIFSTTDHRVTAGNDFLAQAPSSDSKTSDSKLSGTWIALPLGLLALIPLLLAALWVRSWIRNERARRAYLRRA